MTKVLNQMLLIECRFVGHKEIHETFFQHKIYYTCEAFQAQFNLKQSWRQVFTITHD